MGNEASSIVNNNLKLIPDEIWHSEWHMLKLSESKKKKNPSKENEKEDGKSSNNEGGNDEEGHAFSVEYEDMVLYEDYIEIFDFAEENSIWAWIDKLHDTASNPKAKAKKIYAVLVHSHIFFFRSKTCRCSAP